MARKLFKKNLAIELRKNLGKSQSEFAQELAEIVKSEREQLENSFYDEDGNCVVGNADVSDLIPSISLRTIRDLENGNPIDEDKGLFIFKKLGSRIDEEIYEPLINYEALSEADHIFHHLLRPLKVSDLHPNTDFSRQLSNADRFYVYLGNIDQEDKNLLLDFISFIENRGKSLSNISSPQDLLERKFNSENCLEKLKENYAVCTAFIEDKFTIFKNEVDKAEVFSEMERYGINDYGEVIPVGKTGFWEIVRNKETIRDYLEIIKDGPQFIFAIGITERKDPILKVDSNKGGVFPISKDFTLDQTFEFKTPKIPFEDSNENEITITPDEFEEIFKRSPSKGVTPEEFKWEFNNQTFQIKSQVVFNDHLRKVFLQIENQANVTKSSD